MDRLTNDSNIEWRKRPRIEEDLSSFNHIFQETSMEPSLPDGSYDVIIEKADLFYSKNDRLILGWDLVVETPLLHSNTLLKKYNRLVTPTNIQWLKKDLAKCGLELEQLSDLPNHLESLKGIKLTVSKRTQGEYENIYFNRRIRDTIEELSTLSWTNAATQDPPTYLGLEEDVKDDIPF